MTGVQTCALPIYPVGIPMLVQGAKRPGWVIGVNGLAGNLGLAGAAALTGLLIKYFGWRMAFLIPGAISILLGILFAICAPHESEAPAKKKVSALQQENIGMAKILMIMTIAATSGSMLFNFSTSSNYELLANKFIEISQDPAQIGIFLSGVYVLASFTQLLIGYLIDKVELKTLYQSVITVQFIGLLLANSSDGWAFYTAQLLFMAAIFGAIPFTEDRKSTRLNSSHMSESRMPSSA